MLVLRFAGLAVALALGLLVILYIVSGDRKWLRIAWRVFKVALVAAALFLLVVFFERLVPMV
jgi:hypothetical protein